MTDWVDFKLESPEPGVKTAERPGLKVAVIGEDAVVFHRRDIKLQGNVQTQVSALVGRLNGVSIYLTDDTLVMTAEDIYL